MRVFCINSDGWYESKKFLWFKRDVDCDGPTYGDIVTVVNKYYEGGILYYNITEWPPCIGDNGFEAECFIPLSDIDEVELLKARWQFVMDGTPLVEGKTTHLITVPEQ